MGQMTAEFRVPQSVPATELAAAPAPEQRLAQHRESLRVWDAYWRDKVEDYGAADDTEALAEVAQIRAFIRELVMPRLEQVAQSPPAQLGPFLKLMIPFASEGGLQEFLLHFFQLEQDGAGKLVYRRRDPFERDVFLLHDLYKVRKTLEVVDTLRMARGIPERRFPSRFSEADIRRTLDGMTEILQLLYRQCLPPQQVTELVPQLGPHLFHGAAVLARREADVCHGLPQALEKYDYRRFFFLLYFKSGLRAKVGGEARDLRYNFLHFQILRQEFLQHWLTEVLREHPQKYQAYQRYAFRGKTLLAWIAEAPEQEADLLAEMSAPAFESVAGEVNALVPDELKVGAATESATTGFHFRLKQQLAEAAAMAAAPLEALRRRLAEDPRAGQVLTEDVAAPSLAVPGAASPATPAAPTPPADSAAE